MHADLVFRTSRFNLSKPQPYFINDCCFGDDLAKWLVGRFPDTGIEVDSRAPYQEDWGWEFGAKLGTSRYYIGVGGNSDGDPANSNRGEWRIMFTKRRTLWERLTRKNKLAPDEPIMKAIEDLLKREPDFIDLHLEDAPD